MFGDLGKMMALAGKLKTELPKMKQRLAESEFAADAGGGAVSATVNGKMQILAVKFTPEVVADNDPEMLADLVKVAVTAAQEQAAEAAKAALNELTGGVDLPGLSDAL